MRNRNILSLVLTVAASLPLFSDAKIRLEEAKNDKGVITSQRYYDEDKLIEHRLYNQDGVLGTLLRYQYPSAGRIVSTKYSVDAAEPGRILSQEERAGDVLLRTWIFSDRAPYAVEYIENYDSKIPTRVASKTYVNSKNQVTSTIYLTYVEGKEKPVSFIEKTPQGKILTRYQINEKYDLPARLEELGKSRAEIDRLVKQRENPDKFLVAIIDSGFDYNHADLVTKWWNNPDDPVDGIDNDGNGWIDDNFGWEHNSNQYLPSENVTPFFRSIRPLSHGTHVAAIASNGLDNIGLIGFAGEYTTVSYVDKISAFIKKHKVKVVNMSLAIPMDYKDQLGLRDTVNAYKRMIEGNPETLFVVASGNEIKDLDIKNNRQYPSSFRLPNVMTVGALDVSRWENIEHGKTKMAYFSNWGKGSVDLLAPGVNVSAASLGGGLIEHSGTSMATPYMVNHIVRLWSKLPHLSASEVHALFVKTVRKMNPAPEIISQGYADLNAALFTGHLESLLNKKPASKGPNCWNSALVLSGISSGIHYTTDSEFRHVIDSPLCQMVPENQTQKGDIIALRRFDSKGNILPASFMSEVHGYLDLGDGTGFTKNGDNADVPYAIQSKADIFAQYKSQEFKNCKILGIDRKECVMKEKAYRCQSLRDFFGDKLTSAQAGLLSQFEKFEVALGQEFKLGSRLEAKDQKLQLLETELENLERIQGPSLFTQTLGLRLKSLSSRL